MHTFSVVLKTAGTQSITASDASSPTITGTESGIVVTPGPVASLEVGTISTLVIGGPGTPAGGAEYFNVFPSDAFGNFATSYTGTINFSSTDPQAVLPASYTFAGDGVVQHFDFSLRTAGTQTVTATDSVSPKLSGSVGYSISAALPVRFTVSGPATATAGVAQNATVTVRDAFGNVVPGFRDLFGGLINGYTGTVTFSSTDLQAGLPTSYTFTPADAGVHTFSVTLKTAGLQSITVTDTATATMTGTLAGGVLVTPGAAVSFVVSNPRVGLTGPTVTTAGVAQNFSVTALDAFGNVATGYNGTVRISSSDVRAVLPAATTFTAADAGVKWFSETLETVGTQSLTVSDAASPALTNTLAMPVTPAQAATFTVTGASATTAGVAQNVTVTAFDAFGNVAKGYTGTMRFSSSDLQAGLPAGYTFSAADAGVHTFSVTLTTTGAQSITASDAAAPAIAGTQSGIVVTAGLIDHLAIVAPTSAVAGVSFTVKVSAVDAFGNVVTGYRGKVHFTDSATNAGLPSDYTFSSSDNGVHSFSVTMNTVAIQTLTVTDTTTKTITGSVSINVAAKTSGGGGSGH